MENDITEKSEAEETKNAKTDIAECEVDMNEEDDFFEPDEDRPTKEYAERAEKLHEAAVADCVDLYSSKYGRTWDCGLGWYSVLRDASYEIEALNIICRKYGVKVTSAQVKEKFGTLRWYYDVVCERPLANRIFSALTPFLNPDFRLKQVKIKEGQDIEETDEITEEEYKKALEKKEPTCSRYLKDEREEKFYRITRVYHCPQYRYEPTRLKWLYGMKDRLHSVSNAIDGFISRFSEDPKQQAMTIWLDNQVQRIIDRAEEECYKTCEICGAQIGSDYSPRVETSGWIRYICKRCAKYMRLRREKDLETLRQNEKDAGAEPPAPPEEQSNG